MTVDPRQSMSGLLLQTEADLTPLKYKNPRAFVDLRDGNLVRKLLWCACDKFDLGVLDTASRRFLDAIPFGSWRTLS